MVLSLFAVDQHEATELFIKFSRESNIDKFMDINESDYKKSICSEKDARAFINEYINGADLKEVLSNKKTRNHLLKELKARSTLSNRKIATMLDIDRNIVQRVSREKE